MKDQQPATFLGRLLRNEWLKAFVFALGILLLLHLFVVRFVSVQSTSMFSTLLPGDLLLVQRWPKWTGLERDDIVVFRDPLRDKEDKSQRTLMVKRVAALPGDVLEIRRGNVLINGKPVAPAEGVTHSFLVRLKEDASLKDFLARQGMPEELAHGGRNNLELPLNTAMAARVEQDEAVVSVTRMRLANGPQLHLFPFSPRYGWNGDNYGPITVPGKGDTLRITADNLPMYDRLISVYEGHSITAVKNELLLDAKPLKDYVVEQDYYFVLGDSRHYSADSRYWGFLPADHVVGRGGGVLWRNGSE
ncbi:MAG TPA: signal peptidase I [Flavobacteriales bacterium]|nr:signal peptidase I [Flavobacteriales bacterium]